MKMPTPEEVIDNAIKKVSEKMKLGVILISDIPTDNLLRIIKHCNLKYRAGNPIVSNDFYDHTLLAALIERDPKHEFLNKVEPETTSEKTVKLPERMLSTDKAYDLDTIQKWLDRVLKAASELGIHQDSVEFRVTPKLDGFAAYDDGENLYTRGDGYKGTDITRVFDRGVQPHGGRGAGPGELVVVHSYFKSNLSLEFENSRNFMSSVIKEGELSPLVTLAIQNGAVEFVPFSSVNHLTKWRDDLVDSVLESFQIMNDNTSFDTDGIVIECVNQKIKDHMSHTSHHHRWQIAFKQNAAGVEVKVNSLTWQTGKTGVITPVAEIEPTRIGGVTVSRATCHNYGNVMSKGIDAGAIVEIVRSGEVIPYITGVVQSVDVEYPDECPSCGSSTEVLPPAKPGEKETHLSCTNKIDCSAQVEGIIEYWFKTLGNCDGFGPSVISDLASYGVDRVRTIYDLEHDNFVNAGLGAGISSNLLDQLQRSKTEEIEDWRFLAAFSIHTVGKGGCERLLKRHRLLDVFDLTIDDLTAIDGFAEKTATVLYDSLARIKPDFDYLYGLGFNLARTPLLSEAESVYSAIKDKVIVFTGSMKQNNRETMKKQAKLLGASVSNSVTGKTDYLVCGDRVGAAKIKAAEAKGTTVITEDEYLNLLGRKDSQALSHMATA